MNNPYKYKFPGFTLMELLVVISVVAVISTIATVSFNSIRSKQRDSQRITDVKKIAVALERYKNVNGDFPDCGAHFVCDYISSPDIWESCLGEALKPFLGNIPIDPASETGQTYCYKVGYRSSGNQYSLVYFLENVNPNVTSIGDLKLLRNIYNTSEYEVIIQSYRD